MYGVGFQMISLIMAHEGESPINHDSTITNVWTCFGTLPMSPGQPAPLYFFTLKGNLREDR